MENTIAKIRQQFPILDQKVNGHNLAYLDNAATTQKPKVVIDAISEYYEKYNANVHRGVHHLSALATEKYESARKSVQKFINAKSDSECIFVRGTTEAINLVATSFGQKYISQDDEIVISAMEHHSNIVPWQLLCERAGAKLKVIPINNNGDLELDKLDSLLTEKTKIVSVIYGSNSLGTLNPVKQIIEKAHAKNIPVLIDGAQINHHLKVDVQELDCDFFTLSGHKMYGPTGIGVLYAKKKWLDVMPPYHGGGDMILEVSFDKSTYNEAPFKFEAGTPNIAGAIGLAKSMEFIDSIGKDFIGEYEAKLLDYATEEMKKIPDLKIIGTAKQKISINSFVIDGIHPHDLGTIVDQQGVAIRTGHHCTMPVMDFFKVPATSRASFAIYNTQEEIDQLIQALKYAQKIFSR